MEKKRRRYPWVIKTHIPLVGRFTISLAYEILGHPGTGDALQNAILRYGRLKICATSWAVRVCIQAMQDLGSE